MDNPWYFSAGGGISNSDELPYVRPAHLKWEGLSQGDLAQLNGDPDPDARIITFETDRDGFHNGTEIQHADIITLGDSYTEAGNVPEPENFSTLLGQKLKMSSRNLGRAGYSTPSELIVLRKYGLCCQPKIAIWQITESNDLDDAVRYKAWVEGGRRRFFDVALDRKRQQTRGWERHSPTFRLFELLSNHDPRPWPYDGLFLDRNGVEHTIRFMNCPGPRSPVRDHPGWPLVSEALAAGAGLCRSNGVRLLVVMIPTKYRVLGPRTRMLNAALTWTPVTGENEGTDTLEGRLRSWCDSIGVPFIDATTRFRSRSTAGELVYLPYDTHLSPAGHRVLADLLVENLTVGSRSDLDDFVAPVTAVGRDDSDGAGRSNSFRAFTP
jgi:hypothetical protein